MKFLLLLVSISFSCLSSAQDAFNVRQGLARYPLGTAFNPEDTLLKAVEGGVFQYKGKVETTFQWNGIDSTGYALGDIRFPTVLFTYASGTLVRISLTKQFRATATSDYEKLAKKEGEQLYRWLREAWNDAGSKKTFGQSPDGQYKVKGYQWTTANRVMKLALHQQKGTRPFYAIDLVLESKE